jgi:hypothetical protein
MGKLSSVAGVMKTTMSMAKEEWDLMDKKFYRLLFGIATFIAMGLFWFFVASKILPF